VLKLGLRTKFFLYSNAVLVATMTMVAILADLHDRSRAYEVMENRNRKVSDALAIVLADTLDRGQQRPVEAARYSARVDRYIQQTLSANEDVIRYLVVTDPDGIVTHASQATLVGQRFGPRGQHFGVSITDASCACHGAGKPRPVDQRLRPARQASPGGVKVAGGIDTPARGGRMLEVRDLLGGSGRTLGRLSIGFTLAPVARSLATVPRRLVVVVLLLMLVHSLLTALYVEPLIRPILGLNEVMKRAGRGDLTVRAPANRSDEVGQLGAAFNHMMDELGQARDREKVRQTQLAHTEKMAAVGTLAASVAHEVNNPLGGVLTCLENMRADPSNEEMRVRYLALIQNGVERIQRTVANLLDFSRQRPLHPEPISINSSLHGVVELAAYQLRKSGVEVHFGLHPGDPRVMADRSQMEQLFLNLVLNALQAMPEGGTLTLHTGISDGLMFAEVRDTGRGIPPEIRDRIFDPFFTTRATGGGTGLGLAVSESIVGAHGGRIEVTSHVGTGSAFRVWLPRSESTAGGVA
jgi:two-component system NtrC family sensor kinase